MFDSPERITEIKKILKDNLARIHDRIAGAAVRAGRDPHRVQLLAVTKSADVMCIRELLALGQRDIAENRVQQFLQRWGQINEMLAGPMLMSEGLPIAKPRWHMIGHLQRNKVKAIMPIVELIHSVDTLRLVEEISNYAKKINKVQDILIEVNVSGEEQKYGLPVAAVGHLVEQILAMPGLRIRGLMTMAPIVNDPEKTRPLFERLYELFLETKVDYRLGSEFEHLSMGMSQDFEVAVECGATIVRIGTALFEGIEFSQTETE
jgi:pyridoxal phosphate enzyme (YggS family)